MVKMYIIILTMFLRIKIKKIYLAKKEKFKKIYWMRIKIRKYKKYQIMKKKKIEAPKI